MRVIMKIALFANTDWYLYHFRLSLALELRNAGYNVLLISPPGDYGNRLTELGFHWIAAPMDRRSLNPFRELALINWLRCLIRREYVDLVHGFTIKCAVYGALAARLAGGRARVSAVAGMGYVFASEDWRARMLRPLVRAMMRLAFYGERALLILQNSDDVRVFSEEGIVDSARIRLIRGSGVNCSMFSRAATRSTGEPMRVLLAARLLWEKGLGEYVEAARKLKAGGRSIQFLLAGAPDPGNPGAVPETAIHQWQREGLIEWLGHVEDIAALLKRVHVMALPTRYGEGVPRSLLEAAACGLAIVTTDAPGCREVVTHGVEGLLVPVRDSAALADALARLDDAPALATRLGSAARRKVRAEFDEAIVIERTIEAYRELVVAH